MRFREFVEIPLVTLKGRVSQIEHARHGGVKITLSGENGTVLRWMMTTDQYYLAGKPQQEDRLEVVLQRHPKDTSDKPSQIHHVRKL